MNELPASEEEQNPLRSKVQFLNRTIVFQGILGLSERIVPPASLSFNAPLLGSRAVTVL